MSEKDKTLVFETTADDIGKRLDVYLSEQIEDWSRSRLKKLIDEGDVLVNGRVIKSSYRLRENDQISVALVFSDTNSFEPEDIPLDVVFEDEYLAVINKPAGMIVHPGAGVSGGTLANAVAFHFYSDNSPSGNEGEITRSDERASDGRKQNRIGIVHRLDKDTSGLIVVAKNDLTLEKLSAQFRDRKVKKSYVALVHGFVRKLAGKIEEPIARDRKNRVKMAVDKNGRNALSVYKVRRRFEKFTLLDVNIKTGRTHQIRVHMAHIKHPIVGDETYNAGRDNMIADASLRKEIKNLNRFYLHAEKLSFVHPVSKEKMQFTQPLLEELTELLKLL